MFSYAKPESKESSKNTVQKQKKKHGPNPLKAAIKAGTFIPDKNRILSESQKMHIFKGDVNKDSELPTGYHSKIDASTTHEGFGDKTPTGTKTYKQAVRLKADPTKIKTEESTFFPDTASKTDVIYGIEHAPAPTGGSAETTISSPDSVKNITIRLVGDTIFPVRG